MELYIEREDKTITLSVENPKPLIEILKEQEISLESVILVKNDSICLEDEMVSDNDSIKLLSVVSGG